MATRSDLFGGMSASTGGTSPLIEDPNGPGTSMSGTGEDFG